MNCKPNELAIIVRAKTQHQHVGKIVKCIRVLDGDSWICEPELISSNGINIAWLDSHLRPIRGNPGQDQTLDWAPVPSKEKV